MPKGATHGLQPPRRRRAPPRKSRLAPWLIAFAVVVCVFGALWLQHERTPRSDDHKVFIAELQRALAGHDAERYSFGGTVEVETSGGRKIVIARGVPQAVCVEAGWELVRMGTISVNGVTPARVSAGRLAELCSREPGGAIIEWMPKSSSASQQ